MECTPYGVYVTLSTYVQYTAYYHTGHAALVMRNMTLNSSCISASKLNV
jgi:hypothetical protein